MKLEETKHLIRKSINNKKNMIAHTAFHSVLSYASKHFSENSKWTFKMFYFYTATVKIGHKQFSFSRLSKTQKEKLNIHIIRYI